MHERRFRSLLTAKTVVIQGHIAVPEQLLRAAVTHAMICVGIVQNPQIQITCMCPAQDNTLLSGAQGQPDVT